MDLATAEQIARQIQTGQNSGFQDPNKITQNSNVVTTRMNANKDYYNTLNPSPAPVKPGFIQTVGDTIGGAGNMVTGAAKHIGSVLDITSSLGSKLMSPFSALGSTLGGADPWPNVDGNGFWARYKKNLISSMASKTSWEKNFNKDLANPADQREFIAGAAEFPTYFYGGGGVIKEMMSKSAPLLTRVLGGTVIGAETGALQGTLNTYASEDYKNAGAYVKNTLTGGVIGGVTGGVTTVVGGAISDAIAGFKASTDPAVQSAILRYAINNADNVANDGVANMTAKEVSGMGTTLVEKLTNLLPDIKSLRNQTEDLYQRANAARFGKFEAGMNEATTMAEYKAARAGMGGELPKMSLEPTLISFLKQILIVSLLK